MKIREGIIKAHLVPPVFFGLLGESHDWKAPGSTPKDNIKTITNELDRDLVKSPRKGLDFLCIADLAAWTRITAVLPEKFLTQNPNITPLMALATGASGKESLVLSGMRHNYEQKDLSPLTNFIGSLWIKLAINDLSLKPLADGFSVTETTDVSGSFGFVPYKLDDVTTPQIANKYRHSLPWFY